MPCIVIGISGASGSGKSSLSANIVLDLQTRFHVDTVGVICEDFYYRDQSNIPESERVHTNYDHPNSLEHDLLTSHLRALKAGETVQLPQYDYVHHTRSGATIAMAPKSIIIVEGILLFTNAALRAEMDCLIFVDAPLDICLIRRATRDMIERGRTFDSVITQYEATVRPMYFAYIEPSKVHADIIVPSWKDNSVAVGVLLAKLNHDLSKM
ncbi:uridine kinase-like protein [Novymonas esmeraldas]|uniref:Uridine kinase n=1 Tax=Novymonas esmeraldas TaxID=1808958 RepID=A0AAW0F747_9TRYP